MPRDNRNVAELQAMVVAWANDVLPDRTVPGMLLKTVEELGEYVRDPSNRLQLADIFILLLDLADRYDIDVAKAIEDRHGINTIRKWTPNRQTGVMNRE